MVQFLIKVRDKDQIDLLNKLGSVIHKSRLSNIVIFEAEQEVYQKLCNHPNVIDVKISEKFELAY